MGIVDTYEKRHHVFEYEKKNIPDELVKDILYKAWKITPSKNNFMPYHVHVIGPEQQGIKDEVWRKCAFNHRRKEEDSLVFFLLNNASHGACVRSVFFIWLSLQKFLPQEVCSRFSELAFLNFFLMLYQVYFVYHLNLSLEQFEIQ